MLDLFLPFAQSFWNGVSLGRIFEAVVVLGLVWSKLKPQLKILGERLEGLEVAVRDGFKSGEHRFDTIEIDARDTKKRVSKLENQFSVFTKGRENAEGIRS